ncbi:hypothetical protein [Pectobacterium versatile]|uniref:hypothetical protein n=1 Tax=Pectobacterium versatile TaxID=2488639 RepID=UPI0020BE9E63|nr:hypothetical protein [Pectobacterium versatile]
MNVKYLYGKYEFLADLLKGRSGIRFSDLSHYSRLENEKMRDDEMNKLFILKKEEIIIEINGYRLDSNDLAGDSTLSVIPRHCYCLCLSSKGNDDGLYRDFKADTCIAFNVDELEKRISLSSEKFKGSHIVGGDITYYDQNTLFGLEQSPEKLVFYKPDFFAHESEYRIAWFYPLDKAGFLVNGRTIPFRFENESSHLFIFHKEKDFITDCIVDVYTKS